MARITDTVTLFLRATQASQRENESLGGMYVRTFADCESATDAMAVSAGHMARHGVSWANALASRVRGWYRAGGALGALGVRAPNWGVMLARQLDAAARNAQQANLLRLQAAADATAARDLALRAVLAQQGPGADRAKADAILRQYAVGYGVPYERVADVAKHLFSQGFTKDVYDRGGSLETMLNMLAAFGRLRFQPGHSSEHEVRAAAAMLAAWGQEKNSDNLRRLAGMAFGLHQVTPLSLHDLTQAAGEANALRLAADVPPREQLALMALLLRVQRGQRVPIQLRRFVTGLTSAASVDDRRRALRGLGLGPRDVDLIGESLPQVIRLLAAKRKDLLPEGPAAVVDAFHSVMQRADVTLKRTPDDNRVVTWFRDHTWYGAAADALQREVGATRRRLWDRGPLTEADFNERLELLFGLKTMPGAQVLLRDFDALFEELLALADGGMPAYELAVQTALAGPAGLSARAEEAEVQEHYDEQAAFNMALAQLVRAEAMKDVPQLVANRLRERFIELLTDPLFTHSLDESLREAARGRSAVPLLYSRLTSGNIVVDAASEHLYREKLQAAIQRALTTATREATLPDAPVEHRKAFRDLIRKYPAAVAAMAQHAAGGVAWIKENLLPLERGLGKPADWANAEKFLARVEQVLRLAPDRFRRDGLLLPSTFHALPKVRTRGNVDYLEAAYLYGQDRFENVTLDRFQDAWRQFEAHQGELPYLREELGKLSVGEFNPDQMTWRRGSDRPDPPVLRFRAMLKALLPLTKFSQLATDGGRTLDRLLDIYNAQLRANEADLEATEDSRLRGDHVPLPAPPDPEPAKRQWKELLKELYREYDRQETLHEKSGQSRRPRVLLDVPGAPALVGQYVTPLPA